MLFTDIEGSTSLLKQLGERYGDLLFEHRRLLRAAFTANGGREMDTQGDAFFVAFPRARNAVAAAIEGQRALRAHEWPDGVECRVRMGLHTGEPSVRDEGYHGLGLHRGARIASAAHGGQVLLSSTTADLVQDDLPAGVSLRGLGRKRLKDLDRSEHIYQLVADGLPSQFPRLRTADSNRPRRRRAVAATTSVVVIAAVAVWGVFATRSGSGPSTASAAAVSADSVGLFDASSGKLDGHIPVGTSPGAVAAGDGSVWVTNSDARTVSRVDPVERAVIDTIPVGNDPDGIAYGGGFVWVANGLDGTVTQIDPGIDQPVDTIAVGSGPSGVAVEGLDVWVANSGDGTVSEIGARTGKQIRTITVGQSADGIAVGFRSVWVTSVVSGTVTRLDAGSGASEQSIATGSGASAVAVAGNGVWVANNLDGTVTHIDPATDSVRATISVGNGPDGIAAATHAVWVSNELSGTLSKIDPSRDVTVGGALRTGNRPEGIVLASGMLFAAVRTSGAGHSGGTLTVLADRGQITTVDPAQAFDPAQYQILVLTNDGLTAFRKVGGSAGKQLVPDLAVALPTATDGGRSYSFRLRRGIHYSTGALVRPEDFRTAIERYLALTGGAVGTGLERITGADRCLADRSKPCSLSRGIVTDDTANGVTFHLTGPDPEFLDALATAPAFVVPAGTPLHARGFLPATGPYKIASFDPKQGIRLVRNPRFREWSHAAQPRGFPNVIVERWPGTRDARVAAVLGGSADLATSASAPSPSVLRSVQTQHASQLEQNPLINIWALVLDTRVTPFDDVRARRALNFALDRGRLRDLTVGVGALTCQILPPGLAGYQRYCPYTVQPSKSGIWVAPDLARARQLVRESGTVGERVSFWIPDWIGFNAGAGRYVVSVLDSIGYRARLRLAPNPYATEDKRRIQAGFWGWGPNFPTPSGFIVGGLNCASYTRNNSLNENVAEFCDPRIDREIASAQSLQTTDPGAASRLWTRIDHDLTTQAPWAPFATSVLTEVKSLRVGDYQFNPQWSTLLDQLWVR